MKAQVWSIGHCLLTPRVEHLCFVNLHRLNKRGNICKKKTDNMQVEMRNFRVVFQ